MTGKSDNRKKHGIAGGTNAVERLRKAIAEGDEDD